VFTGGMHLVAGNLVGAFLPGYPGEVNLMFATGFVNHQQVNQVFIQFRRQAFLAYRTVKIEPLAFFELKPRMFDA
jgi:hypothetical protein